MDRMVTVVVAVKDTPARMLKECWQSILGQTWSHWRAIFLDDGSTNPETLAVLREIAQDKRAKVIRQEAAGISRALNRGLAEAQTDLVAILDHDDLMMPDRLRLQVEYMQAHPEVDILGGQMEAFDDQTGQICWQTHHKHQIEWAEVQERLWKEHPWILSHPAVIYRRSRILALGGYDPSWEYGQDLDLWIRALRAGYQLRNLPQIVTRYRLHAGQTSRRRESTASASRLVEKWRRVLQQEGTRKIFLVGYPGSVGGAGTECWHTLRLWRRYNLQVTLIPTWGAPLPCWRQKVNMLGYPTWETTAEKLQEIPGLRGAIVVSFCNSQFLAHADRFRDLGCRIVWAGCMCWLFEAERRHYERRGPFDAYVFQSQHQMDCLRPQLARYGVKPEQMHLVRAAFMTEEWPFRPRPHRRGEPLVVGRISRAAPDKYHPQTWQIYQRIPHPVRARVMAWSQEVERKVGPPPRWAEALPVNAESSQDFIARLHVMLQANGGAQENWPRSGLEAMATGVPLVVPNRWGWKEMVIHGRTGFLADTDDELSYYAARLGYDEGLRQYMAREGRKHLQQQLAPPDIIWQRWEAVFACV